MNARQCARADKHEPHAWRQVETTAQPAAGPFYCTGAGMGWPGVAHLFAPGPWRRTDCCRVSVDALPPYDVLVNYAPYATCVGVQPEGN
jgi:hypothetical protein